MFFYPASNIKNEKLACKKFTLFFQFLNSFIYLMHQFLSKIIAQLLSVSNNTEHVKCD